MGKPARPEVFREFLKKYGHGKVVIATHTRADADGISSAYALSKAIPGSTIATAEEMNEGAKQLSARLGAEPADLGKLDRKQYDGLVVVDTSAYTLLPQAKGWKILCIIDHHRADGRDMKGEFEILDQESPSTAEIITGLFGANGIAIPKDVAFGLAVAVIADAARFKSARKETFSALAGLMEAAGAPYDELLSYAEPEPKEEVKIAILSAMKRVEFVYAAGHIIATSEVGSNESDAASLISEAADVAFVANWKDRERESRISARARRSVRVPLNEVMGEVGRALGGAGGGHRKAAGASVKAHTKEALKKCVEAFIAIAEKEAR